MISRAVGTLQRAKSNEFGLFISASAHLAQEFSYNNLPPVPLVGQFSIPVIKFRHNWWFLNRAIITDDCEAL